MIKQWIAFGVALQRRQSDGCVDRTENGRACVDEAMAKGFALWAKQTDGGASAAPRRAITEAVIGNPPASPAGVGTGSQIGVRLKHPEGD